MRNKVEKFPAMQLFTTSFVAETVHISNEKTGMYIKMLCFHWTKHAKPFSTNQAYSICNANDEKTRKLVNEVLDEFFITEPDGDDSWVNKKVVEELQYLINKYEEKSRSGALGGLAKSFFNGSKSVAPRLRPSPSPNDNILDSFETFWANITRKRGSKKKAWEIYKRTELEHFDPKELAGHFNRLAAKTNELKFIPHVSTWIREERWKDEETNKPVDIPEPKVIHNGIELKKVGEIGHHTEYSDGKGNVWLKHKFKDIPLELKK